MTTIDLTCMWRPFWCDSRNPVLWRCGHVDFDTDQRTLVLEIGNSTAPQNRRPCKNLYAVLSDEQKKEADEIDIPMVGMMGGPWG